MISDQIFVFGSNEAGVHGAGAAKFALDNCGAVLGKGVGRQGNSYAIPTKDGKIQTLPIQAIRPYVRQFIRYAKEHPELEFFVTRIGCGLAGYTEEDIAPLFHGAPFNCIMPPGWVAMMSGFTEHNDSYPFPVLTP